jgi:hypothetical protein
LQQWAQEKCQWVNDKQCQLEFGNSLLDSRQVKESQRDWGNEDFITVGFKFGQAFVPNGKVFKGDNANPTLATG